MEDNRGFKNRYVEKYNWCDICYEEKQEFLACNICVFWTCPNALIIYISMRKVNVHNVEFFKKYYLGIKNNYQSINKERKNRNKNIWRSN